MNNKSYFNSRKFRYGSVSVTVTVLFIALVMIVNVIFSALAGKFAWYTDMTSEGLYSLTDNCVDLLKNGDPTYASTSESMVQAIDRIRAENTAYNKANGLTWDNGKDASEQDAKNPNEKVQIIFCTDRDALYSYDLTRYVISIAEELQAEFPDYIEVQYYNTVLNPTAVSKYLTTSGTSIAETDCVVAFGTEYRVYYLTAFYVFDDTTGDGEPWALNAEKKLASAILSVTRAEAPVAGILVNHGENDSLVKYTQFLFLLDDAGYEVAAIDLAAVAKGEAEIPDNCRMMLCFNPTTDFLVNDGISEIDEIAVLNDFLDDDNSFVFMVDPNTLNRVDLSNILDYMAEWGVKYEMTNGAANRVKDPTKALTTDGYTFLTNYASGGTGYSLISDIVGKSAVFKNTGSITYADNWTRDVETVDTSADNYDPKTGATFEFATNNSFNGVTRYMVDLVTSTTGAEAYANGSLVSTAAGSTTYGYHLLTVTTELDQIQESNYSVVNNASYVVASASLDFLSDEVLNSTSYGNNDLMMALLRAIGGEVTPVGLQFIPFADTTIDNITTSQYTQYTIILTAVPAILALGIGVYVNVRRKYA
jgi:hypothetical protein